MAAAPAPASRSGAQQDEARQSAAETCSVGWVRVKPQGLSGTTASARAVEVGSQLFGGKLAADRSTFFASPCQLSLPSARIDRGGTAHRTPQQHDACLYTRRSPPSSRASRWHPRAGEG